MSTSKPKPAPDVREDAGLVTVEAATAEEALEELHARLGPGAKILDASKVHRGGVGGFFAREQVQLTARRGDPEPAQPVRAAADADAIRPRADAFTEALATALSQGIAAGNGNGHATNGNGHATNGNGHATGNGHAIGNGNSNGNGHSNGHNGNGHNGNGNGNGNGHAELAMPAVGVSSAVGVIEAPRRTPSPAPAPTGSRRPSPARRVTARPAGKVGEVDWSPDELVRIGLPFKLIEAAARLRTTDDVSWIRAVAANAARLCRPLPEAPALVAGPRAAHLAKALGLPHVGPDDALSMKGTVVVSTSASGADPDWLAEALEGRWLHVVAGGDGWVSLTDAGPLAISWLGEDAFVPAITSAWSAGITLGYGSYGRRVLRANPVDLAMEIRDRVGRR